MAGFAVKLTKEDRAFAIGREAYESAWSELKHIFLVGDLKRDPPHPFVFDERVEVLLTSYGPGDDGDYHWHPSVTEYENVIEGQIGTSEAATGEIDWHGVGDLIVVPAGVCVRRLVRRPVRTLTVKVPSDDGAVRCETCSRTCEARTAPFGGA